jgi:azurin
MMYLRMLGAAALLLAGRFAHAEPCKLAIEANDQMQYSAHELTLPASCTEVQITLRHSGKLPARVMGHNWVLTRDGDMSGIVNAGLSAGSQHGYLPAGDLRIIAATAVVGGGESSTVTFSTSALQEGARYVFFCTSPGHSAVMRGSFVFGDNKKLARAK